MHCDPSVLQVAQFSTLQLAHSFVPPLEYIGATHAVQVPAELYPNIGKQVRHIVPSLLQV
jgi:hypothetical protein